MRGAGSRVMSTPPNSIRPDFFSWRFTMLRRRVVFPAPFGPTMATKDPSRTCTLTSVRTIALWYQALRAAPFRLRAPRLLHQDDPGPRHRLHRPGGVQPQAGPGGLCRRRPGTLRVRESEVPVV